MLETTSRSLSTVEIFRLISPSPRYRRVLRQRLSSHELIVILPSPTLLVVHGSPPSIWNWVYLTGL
jgi:hypothetical protein